MFEPRPYTPEELLAWCRLTTLTLAGAALAYARERDGTVDAFVEYAAEHVGQALGGASQGAVEPATLALALGVEALGAEVRGRAMTAEQGLLEVSDLPSAQLCQDLDDRFELELTPDDLLELAGVTQEEMNRLFDILAGIAQGLEFQREPAEDGDGQRLVLRAW